MENVTVERLCIFGIFAASIAALCWRSVPNRAGRQPALATPAVAAELAEVPVAEPIDVLGASLTPDPNGSFPWYDVTNPDVRPAMAPRPSAIA